MYILFKFCRFGNKFPLSFRILNISSLLLQTLMNVKKIHWTTANNFVWICPLLSLVNVATVTRWMLMNAVVMVRDCTALSQLQQHTAIKTTTATNFICMTINTYSVAKPLQCNRALCVGNHTVSSLIYNQFARVSFSESWNSHASGRVQFQLVENSQVQKWINFVR